jgi:hypothetical protein
MGPGRVSRQSVLKEIRGTKLKRREIVREETLGRPGRHQWNKDQSLKSNYV